MNQEERADYIRKNKKHSLLLAFELLNDLETVVRSDDNLYIYNGKHYDLLTKDDMMARYQTFLLKYGIIEEWRGGKINDIMNGVLSASPTHVKRVDMNGEHHLLCLNNGVLDTSQHPPTLLPHSPEFYFDTAIDVEYDPAATECPNLIAFLRQVMSDNDENVANLIRLGGYLLDYSPANMKKCSKMFLFDGPGGAGKSTLIDIYKLFFAKRQVTALTLDDLAASSFRISQLLYSRINVAGEQKRHMVDAEALKLIIEGAPITIEPKFKEAITFNPKTKLIVACNGLPRFSDTSDGINRRLLIFRFRNQYKSQHEYDRTPNPQSRNIYVKDVDLFDRIEQEKSAIFNLFLGGLQELKSNKFQFIESADQIAVMEEFKNDNDTVREFLKSRYEVAEGLQMAAKEVFYAYSDWYRLNVGVALKMRSNEMGKRIVEVFGVQPNGRVRFRDPHTDEIERMTSYPLAKISYEIDDSPASQPTGFWD